MLKDNTRTEFSSIFYYSLSKRYKAHTHTYYVCKSVRCSASFSWPIKYLKWNRAAMRRNIPQIIRSVRKIINLGPKCRLNGFVIEIGRSRMVIRTWFLYKISGRKCGAATTEH